MPSTSQRALATIAPRHRCASSSSTPSSFPERSPHRRGPLIQSENQTSEEVTTDLRPQITLKSSRLDTDGAHALLFPASCSSTTPGTDPSCVHPRTTLYTVLSSRLPTILLVSRPCPPAATPSSSTPRRRCLLYFLKLFGRRGVPALRARVRRRVW